MAATVTLPTPAEAATSNAYEAMPNFVGLGQYSVHAEMYSAQLYYKTTGPGANSPNWTRVVGEIPAAGTMIHPFSTVILEVTTVRVVTVVHRALKKTVVVAVHHAVKKTTKKTVVVAARRTGKKPVVKLESVTRQSVKVPTKPGKKKATSRPALADFRVGVATWYSYVPGRCATWYLPMGTRVNVEDLDNGRVISCVVTDREAAHGDRVVDLSETQFAELAPLGVGVVPVRVTW
jgi:hypothetical protein